MTLNTSYFLSYLQKTCISDRAVPLPGLFCQREISGMFPKFTARLIPGTGWSCVFSPQL